MVEGGVESCDVARMTTKPLKNLEAEIERLVREHLLAQRRAAAAALERAFASAATPTRGTAARPSTTRRRRTAAEMTGSVARLYDAVRANVGETMTVIAAHLGETPRALNRPMAHLKRSGRVRSAGQRQHTRYFPMGTSRSG